MKQPSKYPPVPKPVTIGASLIGVGSLLALMTITLNGGGGLPLFDASGCTITPGTFVLGSVGPQQAVSALERSAVDVGTPDVGVQDIGTPGRDDQSGYGRIDVYSAMVAVYDLNDDKSIDVTDAVLDLLAFGHTNPDEITNVEYDWATNGGGTDLADVLAILRNFGQRSCGA